LARTERRRLFALLAVVLAVLLAGSLAAPDASADVIPRGSKKIPARVVLRAGRFDDYCEHRMTVAKGDTFEGLAERAYGDRERAKEVAAANPQLDAAKLAIGAKVIVPPKLVPPADAKEALAFEFWGWCAISGNLPLQRVYPGEATGFTSQFFRLIAVPAVTSADFDQLVAAEQAKNPRATGVWGEEIVRKAPWKLEARGISIATLVDEFSLAVESTTPLDIVALDPNRTDPDQRFVVETGTPEYRDLTGRVFKSRFEVDGPELLLPLLLIALAGAGGLWRLRRRRISAQVAAP